MDIYAYSHVGNSRDNHEDNYLIGKGIYISPCLRDKIENEKKCNIQMMEDVKEDFCCFVSDGMGGYGFGEEASLETVKYLDENYEMFLEEANGNKDNIKKLVRDLNYSILKSKSENQIYRSMGATLCGIISSGDNLIGVNIGDSRLYKYTNNNLVQISVDNSEGQRLLNLGLLTVEEEKNFPNRKAIYKYIGKNIDLVPDIYDVGQIKKDEMLLICSDGLSDAMTTTEIESILKKENISTLDKGKFLVEIALENKQENGDNITLIIIRKKDDK